MDANHTSFGLSSQLWVVSLRWYWLQAALYPSAHSIGEEHFELKLLFILQKERPQTPSPNKAVVSYDQARGWLLSRLGATMQNFLMPIYALICGRCI